MDYALRRCCFLTLSFLEDFNAGHEFGNKEMKNLMKEITNKVYTFLKYADDRDFMAAMDIAYPEDWDDPMLDKDFVAVMKKLKEFS